MANTFEQEMLRNGAPQNLASLFTPYSPSVIKGRIGMVDWNPGVFGGVDSRLDPNLIMLNRKANFNDAPHVMPHEMEHVLQNRVKARYPEKGYDMAVGDEYNRLNKGAPIRSQIMKTLEESSANPKIPDYFMKTYGIPLKYFGNPMGYFKRKDGLSLQEQWAEISAAEQYLKKDLTKDPFVRKNIFGDDQTLIDVYKGTTGLRTERLDARDLPPMTAFESPKEGFLQNMMKKFR